MAMGEETRVCNNPLRKSIISLENVDMLYIRRDFNRESHGFELKESAFFS